MILFLLVVALNATEIYSQDVQNEDSVSLHKKRWALQFQVGNNFTLNSFQGSIISLKKTLSEKSALRIGVSFGTGVSANNQTMTRVPPDSNQDKRNYDNTIFDFNILSQYIKYLPLEDHVAGYYGIGPIVGYSFNKNKTKYEYLSAYNSYTSSGTITTTTKTWNIGANAVFGVEWFVRKNMSMSAEYAASLIYSKSKWVQKDEYSYSDNYSMGSNGYKTQGDSHGINLRANRVLFGLSVYFE